MTTHIAAPLLPLDADPRTATGRTLGWGIVSTGRIARKVTPDIASLEDSRLVAVSSRAQDSAEAFALDFGVERAYGDAEGHSGLERMLADPEVDVVYVASPHGQHRDHALAAIRAGKHVVCEKAFTVNAGEAREVFRAAREQQVFVMEAVWTRFQPGVQRLLRLVADGEIGEVEWVQTDLGFAAPADPEHRIWRKDAGGGALLDLGAYVMLWPWGAMGFPSGADITARLRDGVDELSSITGSYRGGVAQMQMSLVSSCPSTATISGTKGSIRVNAPMHSPRSAVVSLSGDAQESGQAGSEETLEFPFTGVGYVYEMREATTRIQRGDLESPVMCWDDTLRQMELFDSLRRQIGVRYPNDAA